MRLGPVSTASIWAKVGQIVYGAESDQVDKMYFEDRHLSSVDFINDAFRDDLLVEGGVFGTECARLYIKPDDKVSHELGKP